MKKYYAVLLMLPLLASCRGNVISRSDALKVSDNIRKELVSNVEFDAYTQVVETATQSTTTVYNFYSRADKFFHTYTIKTEDGGRVDESWRFVKEYEINGETKDYIFSVVRDIREVNYQDLSKQYVVNYEEYTDEAWEVYANEYENRLLVLHTDALNHVDALLGDTTTDNLEIRSSNENSLYLLSTQQVEGTEKTDTKYEVIFTNNRLESIVNISDTDEVKNNIAYSIGDIYYPSFTIDAPSSNED